MYGQLTHTAHTLTVYTVRCSSAYKVESRLEDQRWKHEEEDGVRVQVLPTPDGVPKHAQVNPFLQYAPQCAHHAHNYSERERKPFRQSMAQHRVNHHAGDKGKHQDREDLIHIGMRVSSATHGAGNRLQGTNPPAAGCLRRVVKAPLVGTWQDDRVKIWHLLRHGSQAHDLRGQADSRGVCTTACAVIGVPFPLALEARRCEVQSRRWRRRITSAPLPEAAGMWWKLHPQPATARCSWPAMAMATTSTHVLYGPQPSFLVDCM